MHATESIKEADSPTYIKSIPEVVDHGVLNELGETRSIVGKCCHEPTQCNSLRMRISLLDPFPRCIMIVVDAALT
jgi:hypothetical protein